MSGKDQYGICHICGKIGRLTFEHIPPKTAFNSKKAIVYNGEQNVGTVYLYKIDTLYNIFLTVHGTSTSII